MQHPLLLVTGFGPFEDVPENASGLAARRLEEEPPDGVEVRSEVLPVSFRRAPEAFEEFYSREASREPALVLGLGVHRRGTYRVETCARSRLTRRRRGDVDGITAREAGTRRGKVLRTGLEAEARRYVGATPGFVLSNWAGGYVCERIYRVLLESSERRGHRALFVHVPPLARADVSAQRDALARLVTALL